MSDLIYLHNPRCRKSREGLVLLEGKGVVPSVREYLKDPLTKEEVLKLIHQLEIEPLSGGLIRKGEAEFKDHFKGRSLRPDEWAQVIVDHPKLLERPILIKGGKAVIGRPPEHLLKLL